VQKAAIKIRRLADVVVDPVANLAAAVAAGLLGKRREAYRVRGRGGRPRLDLGLVEQKPKAEKVGSRPAAKAAFTGCVSG